MQGYHLTWEGTDAFDDAIEAWKSGPVVSSLWHAEKLGRCVESADVPPESVRNAITYTLRRHGDLSDSEVSSAARAESPWVHATDAGNRFSNQVMPHRSLIDFFNIESPELQRLRAAVNATRVVSPFVPDPPDMRDALIAEDSQNPSGVEFRALTSQRLHAYGVSPLLHDKLDDSRSVRRPSSERTPVVPSLSLRHRVTATCQSDGRSPPVKMRGRRSRSKDSR